MTFVECVFSIIEKDKIKPVLPDDYKMMGFGGKNIYIGIYEDGILKEVYEANPNDVDWEIVE